MMAVLFGVVLVSLTGFSSDAHATLWGVIGAWTGSAGTDAWMDTGGCGAAGAGKIGFVICNLVISFEILPTALSALSYLFALTLAFLGILKLKDHVLDPRNVPLWEPFKRIIACGMFATLPYMVGVLMNSINYGFVTTNVRTFSSSAAVAAGYIEDNTLESMLLGLMESLAFPMSVAVSSFAWVAGLIFIMVGISRLMKSSQDGPRGPGGIGTMMTFLVGAILMSLNTMVAVMTHSLFGSEGYNTYAVLATSTAGLTLEQEAHIMAIVSAVTMFTIIVGWVSFTRGFFILREHSEGGGQASLMSAFTHIIAGALAVNIGPLLNVVQVTLGLEEFGIYFT